MEGLNTLSRAAGLGLGLQTPTIGATSPLTLPAASQQDLRRFPRLSDTDASPLGRPTGPWGNRVDINEDMSHSEIDAIVFLAFNTKKMTPYLSLVGDLLHVPKYTDKGNYRTTLKVAKSWKSWGSRKKNMSEKEKVKFIKCCFRLDREDQFKVQDAYHDMLRLASEEATLERERSPNRTGNEYVRMAHLRMEGAMQKHWIEALGVMPTRSVIDSVSNFEKLTLEACTEHGPALWRNSIVRSGNPLMLVAISTSTVWTASQGPWIM
jgi:hypothetical protein